MEQIQTFHRKLLRDLPHHPLSGPLYLPRRCLFVLLLDVSLDRTALLEKGVWQARSPPEKDKHRCSFSDCLLYGLQIRLYDIDRTYLDTGL